MCWLILEELKVGEITEFSCFQVSYFGTVKVEECVCWPSELGGLGAPCGFGVSLSRLPRFLSALKLLKNRQATQAVYV